MWYVVIQMVAFGHENHFQNAIYKPWNERGRLLHLGTCQAGRVRAFGVTLNKMHQISF
jgi:hypothetical protein